MSSLKLMGSHQTAKQDSTRSCCCCCFLYVSVKVFASEMRAFVHLPETMFANTFCCSIGFLQLKQSIVEKLQHLVRLIDYLSFSLIHDSNAYERGFKSSTCKANDTKLFRTLNFALLRAPNFEHFVCISNRNHLEKCQHKHHILCKYLKQRTPKIFTC